MKNKMTISEFRQYIIAEAKKLLKIEVLKEEKNKIENKLSILNECVPPTYDKNGNPNYIAGAPLMSPETLAKVRAEMLKKASGWATPEQKQKLDEKKVNPWAVCHASTGPEKGEKFEKCVMDVKKKQGMKEGEKPSAGLSKEKKSAIVKKAKAGEDIGKKGKGFKSVAAKAAKEYGSKESGEKVAAAALWKNLKRE